MPNGFAYMMLLIWPVVMIVLFRKTSPDRALAWSLLGAYLLLPRGIGWDLPMIPALDKTTLPNVALLLICLALVEKKPRLFNGGILFNTLILIFILSPFATATTNSEPVHWGIVVIGGLSFYDAISVTVEQLILVIPLFLARAYIDTEEKLINVLKIFVTCALAYSILILFEVRMSPQLHKWVYGYFPGVFNQQIRFGGFRPAVFLGHGLKVAFFISVAVIAYVVYRKSLEGKARRLSSLGIAYLSVILVLCKTVGAAFYAVVFIPILLLGSVRRQAQVALVIAVFVFAYPVLRGADLIPVDTVLNLAAKIQQERADSLEFRFRNEAQLLEHAQKKPLFGWGTWGRNEIYNPDTGRSETVTDGYWIIAIGTRGWAGFTAVFGLLILPVYLLHRNRKRLGDQPGFKIAVGISFMLCANLVNLLPNAGLPTFTWMLVGALIGYLERATSGALSEGPAADVAEVPRDTKPPRLATSFTRQAGPGRFSRF